MIKIITGEDITSNPVSLLMEEGIEPTIELDPISSMVNAVELPKSPKVGGMIPLRLFPLRTNEVKAVF